jgi:hypothetical protein
MSLEVMSPPDPATAEARSLMLAFAERTGLGSARASRRYLWTDAFAVCNFLGLWRATRDRRALERALQLVTDVHAVLGHHRGDDGRRGWLSGLPAGEAAARPTVAGLRIGKKLPERRADDPFDERLEWDRDGQYFHYLTRWMHALDQAARASGEARLAVSARELAATAHRAFATDAGGCGRRLYWKMSIDLSRPLVASTGQHDALDGLVTYAALDAAGARPKLAAAVADLAEMVAAQELATTDPLGLGGLLVDASRIAALMRGGSFADGALLERVLAAAVEGLDAYAHGQELFQPAARRLAFRELGLAIGIEAARLASEAPPHGQAAPDAAAFLEVHVRYEALGAAIRDFWREPAHRDTASWREHADINDVMLATCLLPEGYLVPAA